MALFRMLTVLLLLGAPVILQGTRNTRDLGGLPLSGGKVKPGLVYRSGALCFITPQDVETLKALKIRTLVDLRKRTEIDKDGVDRLVGPRVLYLPMTNSQGLGQEAYKYYMVESAPAFQGFFGALADESSYPLLFHCSAGKDRTGILAALLLELLGASREVIEEDYLQSLKNSPRLVVKPEWLGEVFSAVDKAGGIQAFLLANGVSAAQQERIRSLLIDPKRP